MKIGIRLKMSSNKGKLTNKNLCTTINSVTIYSTTDQTYRKVLSPENWCLLVLPGT